MDYWKLMIGLIGLCYALNRVLSSDPGDGFMVAVLSTMVLWWSTEDKRYE